MTEEEYEKLLKEQDWFYARSDNFTVYSNGRDTHKRLREIADTNPNLEALYLKAKPKGM